MRYEAQGKHFEDWQVGEEFETGHRTVTETDIVLYASLSGDYNPLHTNEEFAKKTVFKTRVAHGFLVHSIAIGLMSQTNAFEGTLIARKADREVRFTRGVLAGDTIYARVRVAEKHEGPDPGQGEVVFGVHVMNQRGDVCAQSTQTLAIRKKDRETCSKAEE